jgi:hypothetical protein
MRQQLLFMHYTELIDWQRTDGQWLNITFTANLEDKTCDYPVAHGNQISV